MSLFQQGMVELSNGGFSDYKIECDVLTKDDWDCLAMLIAQRSAPFGSVLGVPRGGLLLAESLQPYITEGPLLAVDDVLTTGGSIMALIEHCGRKIGPGGQTDAFGWVVFARAPVTHRNVHALFQMSTYW